MASERTETKSSGEMLEAPVGERVALAKMDTEVQLASIASRSRDRMMLPIAVAAAFFASALFTLFPIRPPDKFVQDALAQCETRIEARVAQLEKEHHPDGHVDHSGHGDHGQHEPEFPCVCSAGAELLGCGLGVHCTEDLRLGCERSLNTHRDKSLVPFVCHDERPRAMAATGN